MTAMAQPIELSASCSADDAPVALIPTADVPRVAALALPFLVKLEPANRGCADAAGLLERCEMGSMQLWIVCDPESRDAIGIMLTELVRYPKVFACRFVGACGEGLFRVSPRKLLARLEEWARFQGCDKFICRGRAPWRRYLGAEYTETARVWERSL